MQAGNAVCLRIIHLLLLEKLERAKGFEPSTPTLARLCSTPELRPLDCPDHRPLCRWIPETTGGEGASFRVVSHLVDERVNSPKLRV